MNNNSTPAMQLRTCGPAGDAPIPWGCPQPMEEAPFGGGAPNFVIFVDYYCAKIIAPRCAGGAPTDLQGVPPTYNRGCPKHMGGAPNL